MLDEKYILSAAYVPEHIPKLMSFLSGGEPALLNKNYLYFKGENWLIFIGYPLDRNFDINEFGNSIQQVLKKFKPETLWLLTDEIPDFLQEKFKKLEDDYYYKLDIKNLVINKKLIKVVEKASDKLKVVVEKIYTEQHKDLTNEFLKTREVSKNVRQLYIKLPEYLKKSETTFLLSTYTKEGRLTAYYIIEMEAEQFSAYLIGCNSKINYVSYSSDLLMYELIKISQKEGKKYINLGIGVNEGIRRFKEKWGGIPFLKYRTYEYSRVNFLDYFLINP
ncbi:hypothetical protein TISLANDTSLP1_08880 [Thermodesulfovibrio yellowstonii]|uniref:BioF2-like acetyltransferase domain-containing protein n=1 Tax=Thermodesulfovibrio yellowstonii TaxID=28262 RepID=A0A9W6LKU4_9BACT|nr:hypothetical protein TISLANDTSLP1_08880 [Thermodesulfovibrio islandicus]